MAIEFKMPDLGEDIKSADIGQILISVGDAIEAEQIVLELETDKAVFELPCPHTGTVSKIHVKEGDAVGVGDLVLTLEESGGGAAAKESDSSDQAKQAESEPAEASAEQPQESKTEQPEKEKPASAQTPSADAPEPQPFQERGSGDDRPPAPAGPATRRLARELGVDLYQVAGSGPGGRITSEDVQAFVKQQLSGGMSAAAGPPPEPLPDFSQWGPVERKSMNKIGKTSADHLASAWRTVPHVTQHDVADVTQLESARKRFVQALKGDDVPKVTMTALALKASAIVLSEYPHFNASFDPGAYEVIEKKYFHIGVAVDTPKGLLVPVVRDVDQKSVLQLAGDVTELAVKARDRKLDPASLQGGTFTITNLGGIGGTAFTPIINVPEVAILGMSRSRWEPVVNDDGDVEKRLMLPLSLSYDHRVINGADGARFLRRIAQLLEDPFSLLVEA